MPDDKKISELIELTEAVGSDLLVIVDISEPSINLRTKKITRSDFMGSPGPIGDDNAFSGNFSLLQLPSGSTIDEFSTDGALTGDSDTVVPTEKAVKTYVDNAISGVSLSKIESGNSSVEVIDTGIGRIEIKVDATLVGQWDSGGLQLQSGTSVDEFSTDETLAGDSDTAVPTEKAVKAYVDSQISGAVDHNSTTGLQGGDSTANDYYHLTKDVHDGLYSSSPIIGLGSATGTNLEVDYGTHILTVDIDGDNQVTVNSSGLALKTGGAVNEISTSTSLGSSDTTIVTQNAVKTYADAGDSAILSSAQSYADSGDIATLTSAETYTDNAIGNLINVKHISTDSTAVTGDVLIVDTTTANVNIILIASSDGKIVVKKATDDLNTVIITTTYGTIDGVASVTISSKNQAYILVCDGTNFYIINI